MELLKCHGIPWNFNSRCGDSMEFHGIWCRHQVPWNFQSSMESHGTSLLTWKCSMELLANCEILILINFIIGEVYFIVCCMISCHCISYNPIVVEILRYFNSKTTFWCPSFSACVTLWRQLQTRFIPCESSDQCTNMCSDSIVFFVVISQMHVSVRKHVNSDILKCHSYRCHSILSVYFYTRSK